MTESTRAVIEPEALDPLIELLRARGYRVLGPLVRDGAIVYDELDSADDLPIGWTDRQEAGTYRLERRADEARFGYAVGPHSWKRYLFPPRIRLWRTAGGAPLEPVTEPYDEAPLAFVGVRACELAAIAVQDRVFLGGAHRDPDYAARREGAFLVAVNCFEPAATCFCASMGTGPAVERGFDLSLTELLEDGHRFLVEAASERGRELLAALPHRPAGPADLDAAGASLDRARGGMGRTLETDGVRELLLRNLEHPRWEELAERCLGCASCTLVCPTCFCSAVEEETDLATGDAARRRVWDTCFSVDYSYIHGGSVRSSGRSRYRQWLTHKLATWQDQFGSSGCVGCGRCIAWCPVGIDLTAEAAAIRETDGER